MKKIKKIGKYDVIRVLGRGGMGTVYQCIDPDLQRFTAIKVLNTPQSKTENLYALKMRFLREAITTAQLQHPGIPPVYEVGKDSCRNIFYVMKPIEGIPLSEIIGLLKQGDDQTKEKYDLFALVQVLKNVCQTVEYAHNKGYIHRDLKPSNIFVGNYGEVYVIDWGLTKIIKEFSGTENQDKLRRLREKFELAPDIEIPSPEITHTVLIEDVTRTREFNAVSETPENALEDTLVTKEISLEDMNLTKTLLLSPESKPAADKATLTMDGKIMGTLSYMPPEQAAGSDNLGRETDVYSLGVILYEMLTLKLPIDGNILKDVIRNKVDGQIIPPEAKSPDRNIPPELSAIAMQAMTPSPSGRFKTARELNNALEYWLEGKSSFRSDGLALTEKNNIDLIQPDKKKYWTITDNSIETLSAPKNSNVYLLLKNEFIGDIRLSMNFIAYPGNSENSSISEFAIAFNASVPKKWEGYLDGYTLHLGSGKNTRAALCRHGVEVFSNEYLSIEPRRRYRLDIEHTGNVIKVRLNRQIILYYKEASPIAGLRVGFLNMGKNVSFSDIRVMTRGLPGKVSALDVPEALMNEECYDAAEKRFLAIARGHKNRFLGAWARYRAGIACFLRTGSRKKSSEIWKTLKKTPFRVYEKLGLASIELEKNNTMKAVAIFRKIASDKTPVPNLEAIADIVFAQAQQSLRAKPETLEEWKIIDAWSKLALRFGERMPGRESMTPSILWRWILLSLTEYPEYLSRCIRFLRKFYGEGKGTFAEIVTTIDPLMKILRRSAGISNHEFLVSKVMRLLLNYDDNLGNLETLVRFYMNSGHIDMAKKISLHIYRLCEKHDCEIPDFPVTLLACEAWLDNKKEAASLIETLINKSTGWGVVDGKLLLGLKFYKKGMKDDAEKCWQEIISDPVAVSYNRHLTAKGLLGITEPDPMKAGVPNRSDHRLLYCLFVGYRFYADWQNSGNRESRSVAVKLLKKGMKLRQPSYDIYSAGDIFLRNPLIKMGEKLPPAEKPQPLSAEELTWIEKLTMAASASDAEEFHRTTTIRGINTSSAKNL